MTPTQKIIALAELEGWKPSLDFNNAQSSYHQCVSKGVGINVVWKHITNFDNYLTSHDALQPLLEKMTEEEWIELGLNILDKSPYNTAAESFLKLTPEQKADCILKACGKWEE